MKNNTILQGDALEKLKELPNKSINMLMTSPPYWALRDYSSEVEVIWDGDENCEHNFEIVERQLHSGTIDLNKTVHSALKRGGLETDWKTKDGFCNKCGAWKGQLGLEPTFDLYIKHLCDIFDEVKRVLRDDGTIWINIGDTYYGGGGGGNHYSKEGMEQTDKPRNFLKGTLHPHKSLVMIPFRFAIEMVNRGWILRNVIIWYKRNCMPSSVKDRFTVDFEYLFFFSKKKKYYFEQQLGPTVTKDNIIRDRDTTKLNQTPGRTRMGGLNRNDYDFKNKRTVWTINPKPFSEAHFAVYPEELCETPIKAGCPEFVCEKCGKPKEAIFEPSKEYAKNLRNQGKGWSSERRREALKIGNALRKAKKHISSEYIHKGYKPTCSCNAGFTSGIVLDPFFGAGTTGLVALKQNKKFIGIELNKEYIEIAKKRLKPYLEQRKL